MSENTLYKLTAASNRNERNLLTMIQKKLIKKWKYKISNHSNFSTLDLILLNNRAKTKVSQTSLSGNLQFVVPRNFFEYFGVISMVCLHVEHGKLSSNRPNSRCPPSLHAL